MYLRVVVFIVQTTKTKDHKMISTDKKLRVVKYPNDALTTKCNIVEWDDATHQSLESVTRSMFDLVVQYGAYGISAPQVGITQRFFVLNRYPDTENPRYEDSAKVVVNPEILESNGEIVTVEGCLSLPELFLPIPRFENIKVRYQNAHGATVEEELSGHAAVVFQHENSHLDGELFFQRADQAAQPKITSYLLKLENLSRDGERRARKIQIEKNKRKLKKH